MRPLEEIAEITAELEKLESALKNVTDTSIREVIEMRIEECRLRLRQLQASRPED
jgi:hypothetical protein